MSGTPIRERIQRRFHPLAERFFEFRYGIDSSGYVYLDGFGLDGDELVWHDPSQWLGLRRALRRLDVGPDDVLLDLGCGKGRSLLVAGLFLPFRRVVGVELAEPLAAAARANLASNRERLRAESAEVVTADVLEYEIPEDVTIVYLFSPFIGETFQRAFDRLVEWVDVHDRPLRVVYNFPFEHRRVIASGRAQAIDVQCAKWPLHDRGCPEVIVTYAIAPRDRPEAIEPYLRHAAERMRGAEQWHGPYDPGFVIEGPARTMASPGASQ